MSTVFIRKIYLLYASSPSAKGGGGDAIKGRQCPGLLAFVRPAMGGRGGRSGRADGHNEARSKQMEYRRKQTGGWGGGGGGS